MPAAHQATVTQLTAKSSDVQRVLERGMQWALASWAMLPEVRAPDAWVPRLHG